MLEGMDEAVTGLQAGETTTFTAPLAGATAPAQRPRSPSPSRPSRSASCRRSDDDFAQLASEFDTLDELRDDLREPGRAGQARRAGHAGPRAAARAPRSRPSTSRCPRASSHDEVHRHLEGEGRLEDDEHRAEVDESRPARRFKTQLLLDAVAEKEEVSVNQQELIEYIVAQRRSSTAWTRTSSPRRSTRAARCRRWSPRSPGARRSRVVLEKANVTDAAGNEVDLATLFVDGEDAPAEDPTRSAADRPQEAAPAVAVASATDPTALPTTPSPTSSRTTRRPERVPPDRRPARHAACRAGRAPSANTARQGSNWRRRWR